MPSRHLMDHVVTLSIAAFISAASFLLGRVESAVLSLETKIVAACLASLILVFLQYILAPMRRRSGHWFVQYGSKAAYYGPNFLAFYTANAVFSSIHHNTNEKPDTGRLLAVDCVLALLWWSLFFSSRAGANFLNTTSYSLRKGPSERWRFVQWAAYLAILNWQYPLQPGRPLDVTPHFCLVYAILRDKQSESVMDCQTKAIADYMKLESKLSSPFFDGGNNANSLPLDCCRYPFMQKEDGQWISIRDLVRRDDLQQRLEDQDILLSYSLSRLLARRYHGFHCAEEGDASVRGFALPGLPSNCNRAFTIVEVQLAFLHDYFFTASLPLIEREDRVIPGEWEPLLIGISSMCYYLLTRMAAVLDWSAAPSMLAAASSVLFQIAYLLVNVPIQYRLPKYWGPVVIALHKVNNRADHTLFQNIAGRIHSLIIHLRLGCIWERFRRLLRGTGYESSATSSFSQSPNEQDGPSQNSVYWRKKIGQYSILQDCDRPRSLKKAAVSWFQETVLSQPSYSFIKHLPVQEEDLPVPQSVRELVSDALRNMQGCLPTKGTRSLHPYNLSWTCREETHTDTILIWHIATCYCDMRPLTWESLEVKRYYDAAMALSGYCAYLVAFLPEFLPEHSLTTKVVFQRVLREARDELARTPQIQALALPPHATGHTAFHKGVRLGRELEDLFVDPYLRWKVIAEFWAETMVYIAPSDNAEAHIEHLAQGGEFITHVWALLSNAGILKRATQDYVPPPDDTAAPSSSSKGKGIAYY